MKRFIDEAERSQATLLPETIDDYICEDNPVRAIDAFVGALDLASLGFDGVEAESTGRPAYHPVDDPEDLSRMAISTASSPPVGWSTKPDATSS